TFNTLGHQLLGAGGGVLEIAVGGATAGVGHGAQRTHAAVGLVGTALEQFDLAGRLFGTGEHGAHHHYRGAGGNGLGQVTGEADATVGNQRDASVLQRGGHIGNGGYLRNTDSGNDAGGADGARADTNLDRIGTCSCQRQRGGAGGDVATDHLNMGIGLLDPADAFDDTLGMAVGGSEGDHVYTGLAECVDPLLGLGTGADGRADAPLARLVRARQRVGRGLFDVIDRHHALEAEVVVHHQHALDAVLVQQLAHFIGGG